MFWVSVNIQYFIYSYYFFTTWQHSDVFNSQQLSIYIPSVSLAKHADIFPFHALHYPAIINDMGLHSENGTGERLMPQLLFLSVTNYAGSMWWHRRGKE